jgi:hypothetical protein
LGLKDRNLGFVAMEAYGPIFVGEQFSSGLITGGLISAGFGWDYFLLLRAVL